MPARGPSTNLAFPGVNFAEAFHQLTIATGNLGHQVATALLRYTSRFLSEKPSDRILIARQQKRLQSFLWKQSSPGLNGEGFGIAEQADVIRFIQNTDSSFALKGAPKHRGFSLDV